MQLGIVFLLVFHRAYSFIYEKLADNVDWSIDSVDTALDVNFSPSSNFQLKHMRFLTPSHIERFTLGSVNEKPRRIYKIDSPSTNYTMIYETHEMFVTLHQNDLRHSIIILWSTQSGNRLKQFVVNDPILTYACTNFGQENSLQLFVLTSDLILKRIDLLKGTTIFKYEVPLKVVSQFDKQFKLQTSVVNYQPKIFLYYVQDSQVMVADVSIVNGEPKSVSPYSTPITHDIEKIDLSNDCYTSTHGLVCFFSQPDKESYLFTINRDNFQHQLHLVEKTAFVVKFHSNCILELYTASDKVNRDDVTNTLKYMFYADGIIANITNQIPTNYDNVVVMQQPAEMFSQRIYLGFSLLVNNTYHLIIYGLQFDDKRLEFLTVYETTLKPTNDKHHIHSNDDHLHQMKYILAVENHTYNLYVLCQYFDSEHNQLLQLYNNDVLYWSSESNLGDIINILPIEIMEQRRLNLDESMAYQSNSLILRFLYRLKVGCTSLIKFFIQFGTHFGLARKYTVYKNYRHTTILLVTTSKSYVYGIYTKYGEILWRRKLQHFKPIINPHNDTSSKKRSLPIYLINKAEVKNGKYRSSVAAIVGNMVVESNSFKKRTAIFVFDPLTGNPINDSEYVDFVNVDQFTPLVASQQSIYLLPYTSDGPYNILQLSNAILFSTTYYNDIYVFPSVKKFDKLNLDVVFASTQRNSITGVNLSINKSFQFTKTVQWMINLPADALHVIIQSSTPEYHVDKTKMIFDNRSYKPLNLEDVVVVSYMTAEKHNTVYTLNVMFIGSKTGRIIKIFSKRNIISPESVIISLVSNVCTIISTNYRSKLSTVTSVGLYIDSALETLFSLQETYLLGSSYAFNFACVTSTKFGFSHKSLILSSYDGRLWAVPYKLLDPRRNYRDRIVDTAMTIVSYYPQIDQHPTSIINKNHILTNVSDVVTFPSHLESTSIACSTSSNGLYCSHLIGLNGAPFDILSVNFDHYFVVIFVAGLFIALWFSRNLSKKKKLSNQWL